LLVCVVRKQSDTNGASTRRTYLSVAGAALGTTLLASGNATAGENKKDGDYAEDPEKLEPANGEPIVIDEAGFYKLGDDITVEEGEIGIAIRSSDVRLDGNGKTVSGDGSGAGVSVANEDISNITVADITLKNLQTGIAVSFPRRTLIENVTVKNSEFGLLLDANTISTIVRNSTFDNSPLILGPSERMFLIENMIRGSDSFGIIMEDTIVPSIISNEIVDNDGPGILSPASDSAVIVANIIAKNSDNGIDFSGQSSRAEIRANKIVKNGGFGIVLDEGARDNTIVDNILSDNDDGPCDVATEDNFVGFNSPECEI